MSTERDRVENAVYFYVVHFPKEKIIKIGVTSNNPSLRFGQLKPCSWGDKENVMEIMAIFNGKFMGFNSYNVEDCTRALLRDTENFIQRSTDRFEYDVFPEQFTIQINFKESLTFDTSSTYIPKGTPIKGTIATSIRVRERVAQREGRPISRYVF